MASIDASGNSSRQQSEKQLRCIFDVPSDYFDSCILLPPHYSSSSSVSVPLENTAAASSSSETLDDDSKEGLSSRSNALSRWSCNTCRAEFESLHDQRSHFKSDIHRFNVKLSLAGKNIVNEEDFDDLSSESLCRDYDVSSISGSEDEGDRRSCNDMQKGLVPSVKHKLFMRLKTGEKVSVWKCLFLDDIEKILYDLDKQDTIDNGRLVWLREDEVIGKLKFLIHEPRDNTKLRVVLLAGGGHFAGCVFDGNSVVAHKTFHRYVVRAKAGKKQSAKDGSGKSANSAGASLRRYNELALKKEIQDVLSAWKPYFDAASCVYIHAPSSNRQLLFNGDKPYFSSGRSAVRNVPCTVRRPTLKEARRVYNQLMQVTYEVDERDIESNTKEESLDDVNTRASSGLTAKEVNSVDTLVGGDSSEACPGYEKSNEMTILSDSESELCMSTPLHEASKSANSQKVLELLENGSDPCVKDERGRTPYMLAAEKEVRNTFRRFMAMNLDKWDWFAAKVPSALTKEMEESQAAKQAEKDAKRKAKSKELKKLRKAKEKKAQAEAAVSKTSATALENRVTALSVAPSGGTGVSKEEERKRAQAEEREKRAAAAERRMAAAASQGSSTNSASSSSQTKSMMGLDTTCSCCSDSLAGKVPFHRYNYKYCSTTCMNLHREILEDG